MLLSLVHPDLLNESQNSPLPIPALKRGNRNRSNAVEYNNSNNNDNIFHTNSSHSVPYASLDDMYLLYKLCANILCEDDFKFIIGYCKRLQQGIIDPNVKIILSGNKSGEIYKFITFNLALADRETLNLENNVLPVMIIHPDLEPEIYYNLDCYRVIKC